MKNFLSIAIIVAGVVLIALGFYLWGQNIPTNILVLDIVVTSVCYTLIVSNFFFPLINHKDPAHANAASMGIRWTVMWVYGLAAIVGMIWMYREGAEFGTQLIVQGVLLMVLLLGLLAMTQSTSQAREVYHEEQAVKRPVVELRRLAEDLRMTVDTTTGLPVAVADRMKELASDMRFLSPANTEEARETDTRIATTISDLNYAAADYRLNADRIDQLLRVLQALIQRRKKQYSH